MKNARKTLPFFRDGTLRSDLTVKEVMDTWTLQTGFPLITVTRDYDAGSAKISQVLSENGYRIC